MANLLPLDAQKNRWGAERSRFVVLVSLVSLITSFICALALLPAYVVLLFTTVPTNSVVESRLTVAEIRADTDAVAAAQAYLVLAPALGTIATSTEALNRTLTTRPKGITIDHVAYTPGTFMLSGITDTRESINSYRALLDSEPLFSSVSVPVSNLVGTGGSFTVTVRGSF